MGSWSRREMTAVSNITCVHYGPSLRPWPNKSLIVVSFAVGACCGSPAVCPSER